MTDPLEVLKERMTERLLYPAERDDVNWLIGEVERLRGLLAEIGEGLDDQQLAVRWQLVRADNQRLRGLLGRLEWAGVEEGAGHICPACRFNEHLPDCELAAALEGGNANEASPPKG